MMEAQEATFFISVESQITHRNLRGCIEAYLQRFQEVMFGQTPCTVPEVEGWPGQKPTDRITRIEEFKR